VRVKHGRYKPAPLQRAKEGGFLLHGCPVPHGHQLLEKHNLYAADKKENIDMACPGDAEEDSEKDYGEGDARDNFRPRPLPCRGGGNVVR